MNIIAENIAQRRKELGMTQKELAEKLNISDKTLSRWETDKQVPDALMIPELAKALDMSIGEIYGVEEKEGKYVYESKSAAKSRDEIDYGRITAYKLVLLAGAGTLILGSGIFSFTGVYWSYMKVGAMALLIIGLFSFLTAELTFEEFYQRQEQPEVYIKIQKRWVGAIIPIIGLIVGIVIPVMKVPVITMFNSWDVLLPLVLFQGVVLGLYTKEYFTEKKQKTEVHKITGVYIWAAIGAVCVIGFLINVLSNPYRLQGGFGLQDWQLEGIWSKIKAFELLAGIAFFVMNVLHSKKVLDVVGKAFKKIVKIAGVSIVAVALIFTVVINVVNHNLQSKVTLISGEVPMYQLTNYSYEILDWIKACNLRGEEINILEGYMHVPETGEAAVKYLIYMPHGFEGTEFTAKYQIGWGEKILKIEAESTNQIVDDNYYLCYIEVINNAEEFELQTYLDGERISYGIEGSASVVNVFE